MQKIEFPTDYKAILNRVDSINPLAYSRTRNYLDGAVSYLSPYISRGVISTRQVFSSLFDKGFSLEQTQKLIQELAWREYFQRVWQQLEDGMFDDIRIRYTGVTNKKVPLAVLEGNTGIESIDNGIRDLYETGYMHNHLRMYVASIICNIGRSYWDEPSRWMYYHLLDGDIASNTCSWQWVAGSFSGKQYIANQENINKYTGSHQQGTFLDKTYESLSVSTVPEVLKNFSLPILKTSLPEKKLPVLDKTLPLIIHTNYNLDPLWRKDIRANRILLLEPSHFKQYPVSEKVFDFILQLAKNIEGIQVFTGEVNEIPGLKEYPAIFTKEHPAYKHLPGMKDERDWLFPEVKGFHPSFFSFWKNCEKLLKRNYRNEAVLLRA
jgi:deoxyribodipyrimidine photo-lyase